MTRHRALFFLPLLGLGLACGDDFKPPSRLWKPRILALRAQPVNPPVGTSTTLQPLVYTSGGATVTHHWSWCPLPTDPSAGFACPITEDAFAAFADGLGLRPPPFDLGTGDSITFTNPFPPDLLARLCANDSTLVEPLGAGRTPGGVAAVFTCAVATFPLQITMRTTVATGSGLQELTTVATLFLPTDATTPGNNNPVVGRIAFVPRGEAGQPRLPQPLDERASVAIDFDTDADLEVDVAEEQSEEYLDKTFGPDGLARRDPDGSYVLGPSHERLALSWFSEAGDFKNTLTGYDPKATQADGTPMPFANALRNTWETPLEKDHPAGEVRVLVVVRDNRGGVGWTEAVAGLGAAP